MKISTIGFSQVKSTKKPNIINKNRNVNAKSDFSSNKETSQHFVVTLASFKGEGTLPKNFKKREK